LMISYYLNALFSGQSLYSYYFLNIFIQIFLCIFLYKLFKLLLFNGIEAIIGTIIFLVHPLIVPSIVWIPGREYLLVSVFGILSFINYIHYFSDNSTYRLWISGLFILLSVLSGSSGFVFLFIMILYSFLYQKEKTKIYFSVITAPLISVIILWIALGINSGLFEQVSNSMILPNDYTININSFFLNFKNLLIFFQLVGEFIFPFQINIFPSFDLLHSIIGIAFISLIFVFNYLKAKDKRIYLGIGFIMIYSFINIIMIGKNSEIFSDYPLASSNIGLLGITIVILSVISNFKFDFSKRKYSIILVIIIGILSFISFYESENFKSSSYFYESAHGQFPTDNLISEKLLNSYLDNGRIKEAEELVEKSNSKPQSSTFLYIKLGEYFYLNKNYEKAIPNFKKAVSLDSNNINALNLLINSYHSIKEFEKASSLLLPLTKDSLKFPDARWDLFNIYIESKMYGNAEEFGVTNFKSDTDVIRALQIIDLWSKIFYKENDNVAVVKTMKIGLAIDKDNPVILNYLFDTYTKIGMKEKAREYEKKLMQIFNEQVMEK